MRILALDLGAATGWAYGQPPVLRSGVCHFDFAGRPIGQCLVNFYDWVSDALQAHILHEPIDALVYEAPIHRGGAATLRLKSMAGIVELYAAQHGIDCLSVNLATLRKFATGSGKPSKDKAAMMRRAGELTGQSIIDDNEADAICLLFYAYSLEAIPRTVGETECNSEN